MRKLLTFLTLGFVMLLFTDLAPPGDPQTFDPQDQIVQSLDFVSPAIVVVSQDMDISVPVITAELRIPTLVETYLFSLRTEPLLAVNYDLPAPPGSIESYWPVTCKQRIERYPLILYSKNSTGQNEYKTSFI